jgi:hypothetical protein
VAGSCEYGDEPSGFGATELVKVEDIGGRHFSTNNSFVLLFTFYTNISYITTSPTFEQKYHHAYFRLYCSRLSFQH